MMMPPLGNECLGRSKHISGELSLSLFITKGLLVYALGIN